MPGTTQAQHLACNLARGHTENGRLQSTTQCPRQRNKPSHRPNPSPTRDIAMPKLRTKREPSPTKPIEQPSMVSKEAKQKKGRGRPRGATSYTKELGNIICERLASGESLNAICKS